MDTVKDYLSNGFRLEVRIRNKLELLEYYNSLAETARRARLGIVSRTGDWQKHSVDNSIVKIETVQAELSEDINELIDLKSDIMKKIKKIDNPDYQAVLELRYICNKPWEEIAELLGYSVNNVFRLHRKALDCIEL